MSNNFRNKILNIFCKILYYFPFAMRAADLEIFAQKSSSNSDSQHMIQLAIDKSLGGQLLKQQVTQEVEELRYMTYKVDDASKDYIYDGNGGAILKRRNNHLKKNVLQMNSMIPVTVLETLNKIGDYAPDENYQISVNYNYFTRFNVAKYIYSVEAEKNGCILKVNFLKEPIDRFHKPFLNLLSKSNLNREIVDSIASIHFITFEAKGENDYVVYDFDNMKFLSFEESEKMYVITYEYQSLKTEDLKEKYFSETLDKKYKTKEKKEKNVAYFTDFIKYIEK